MPYENLAFQLKKNPLKPENFSVSNGWHLTWLDVKNKIFKPIKKKAITLVKFSN
jgi:hypothetical protein